MSTRPTAPGAGSEAAGAEQALRAEPRLRWALKELRAAKGPVGARYIRSRFLASGVDVSESTTNRLLRRLDDLGLTHSSDRKGRDLSPLGRALADRLALQDVRGEGLEALAVTSLTDLRDLLVARRGVEREVVRAVAEVASDEQIARLGAVLDGTDPGPFPDRDSAPGIRFHRTLTAFAGNRSLVALGMILFDDDAHEHERLLDVVTASTGGRGTSGHEHREILEAIVRRDGAAAEAAMVRHLDRLIAAAKAPMSQPAWAAFSSDST